MTDRERVKSRAHSLPRFPVILILILVASGSTCESLEVIEDPFNYTESEREELSEVEWRLADVRPSPYYTEEELKTPVMIAPVPDDIPDRFVLPGVVDVGHQGSQASGTAFALGHVAMTYLYQQRKQERDYVCAPAFVYNSLNSRENRGIEIREGAELLKRSGCPHEEHMPYRPHDYLQRPTSRAMRDASAHLIQGFARVDFLDINQVRAHLLQGSVVVVTMRIPENFLKHEGPVWDEPVGRSRGRHTVAVIGYDNLEELIYIQNSAGRDWGKNGRAAIPYAWFIRLVQKAYVIY